MAVSKDELQRQLQCAVLGSAEQVWVVQVNSMPVTGEKTSRNHDTVFVAQCTVGQDLFLGTHIFQRILFQSQH